MRHYDKLALEEDLRTAFRVLWRVDMRLVDAQMPNLELEIHECLIKLVRLLEELGHHPIKLRDIPPRPATPPQSEQLFPEAS